MKLVYLLLFFLLACSPLNANKRPVETVDYLNLERYLGRWYEIARIDNKFQKNCTATQANYSYRTDGDLRVRNTCRLNTPKGPVKEAIARGWIDDDQTNSKLKVQFFFKGVKIPLFAGNYWVLKIDPDYRHVLIGDPTRRYLWVLSRAKKMSQPILNKYVAAAKDQGFDVSKLIKTRH